MRYRAILLLPFLYLLSACGTTADLVNSNYIDGIYYRPQPAPEPVVLKSKEDFEALGRLGAQAGIGRRDTLVVVHQYEDPWDSWYYLPWASSAFYWDSWYYNRYYWGYYPSYYYGPWYHGYYDPWYYDPWYNSHWHHHGGVAHHYPIGSVKRHDGFNYNAGRVNISRNQAQGGSYGSGGSVRVGSSSGSVRVGSGSSAGYRPGSGSNVRSNGSNHSYRAESSAPQNRSGSGYNYVRRANPSGSSSGSTSTSRSYNSNNNS